MVVTASKSYMNQCQLEHGSMPLMQGYTYSNSNITRVQLKKFLTIRNKRCNLGMTIVHDAFQCMCTKGEAFENHIGAATIQMTVQQTANNICQLQSSLLAWSWRAQTAAGQKG